MKILPAGKKNGLAFYGRKMYIESTDKVFFCENSGMNLTKPSIHFLDLKGGVFHEPNLYSAHTCRRNAAAMPPQLLIKSAV